MRRKVPVQNWGRVFVPTGTTALASLGAEVCGAMVELDPELEAFPGVFAVGLAEPAPFVLTPEEDAAMTDAFRRRVTGDVNAWLYGEKPPIPAV